MVDQADLRLHAISGQSVRDRTVLNPVSMHAKGAHQAGEPVDDRHQEDFELVRAQVVPGDAAEAGQEGSVSVPVSQLAPYSQN